MELKSIMAGLDNFIKKLIIVPYGIEIALEHPDPVAAYPYNRTIWN